MLTADEYAAHAEKLIRQAQERNVSLRHLTPFAAVAQVYATLALAAATREGRADR